MRIRIKELWTTTGQQKFATWYLMPLVIIVGLIVIFRLYNLSTLEITRTSHKHGTIDFIKKDYEGYKERLRYKIKLKELDDSFYLENVMIDKVDNLEFISNNRAADIYYIESKGEHEIVAIKVNSFDVLDISRFNDHYKNIMLIVITGTSVFLIWLGVRLYRQRK